MSGKMKKILCAAVIAAVLLLAQLLFGGKTGETRPGGGGTAALHAGPDEAKQAQGPIVPEEEETRVVSVGVGKANGSIAVRFSRSNSGWSADGSRALPADSQKIDRFLTNLLDSDSEPVPEDAAPGLAEGEGVRIELLSESGGGAAWIVGLRPEGVYDRTFVRNPAGEPRLLHADLRGDMDLWENRADAGPNGDLWLDRRAFRFDPWDVVSIAAEYPDHGIRFARDKSGDWYADSYVPGGEWNREEFTNWLADLAEFTISGAGDDNRIPDGGAAQTITVTLAGSGEKTLRVWANHDDSGALAVSSDHPDQVFMLHGWRYRKYFHRAGALFPKAIPTYDPSSIRFIDIRRGGENLKIARRGGQWRAVAVPFDLVPERVDRLARYLSGWQPEDYATPNQSGGRPSYGVPMVEAILADGEVYQYRLAGRHPLYPWRYVIVNGQETFSIPDSEVGVMFPGFADLLDLGLVFSGFDADALATLTVSLPEEGILIFRSGDGGEWSAAREDREDLVRVLSSEEWKKIIAEPLRWQNAGLYERDLRRFAEPVTGTVGIADKNGVKKEIALLTPQDRDVPYIAGEDRGYLIDRADFFNWIAAVREVAAALPREKAGQSGDEPAAAPPTVEDAVNTPETDPAPEAAPQSPAAMPVDEAKKPEAVSEPDADAEERQTGLPVAEQIGADEGEEGVKPGEDTGTNPAAVDASPEEVFAPAETPDDPETDPEVVVPPSDDSPPAGAMPFRQAVEEEPAVTEPGLDSLPTLENDTQGVAVAEMELPVAEGEGPSGESEAGESFLDESAPGSHEKPEDGDDAADGNEAAAPSVDAVSTTLETDAEENDFGENAEATGTIDPDAVDGTSDKGSAASPLGGETADDVFVLPAPEEAPVEPVH